MHVTRSTVVKVIATKPELIAALKHLHPKDLNIQCLPNDGVNVLMELRGCLELTYTKDTTVPNMEPDEELREGN